MLSANVLQFPSRADVTLSDGFCHIQWGVELFTIHVASKSNSAETDTITNTDSKQHYEHQRSSATGTLDQLSDIQPE